MDKAESKYKGCAIYTKIANAKAYKEPSPSSSVVKTYSEAGTKVGYIYGYHPTKINNEYWYIIVPEITLSNVLIYIPLSSFEIKTEELPQKGDIEQLVNMININNIIIYKRLLVTLEIIKRLKIKFKDDASRLNELLKVAQTASELGKTLSQRITTLQSMQSYLTVKTWMDNRYEELKKSVGLSGTGLGALPALLIFGIGAAVAATVVITLYFVLKPTYDASQVDLKVSDTLAKALNTLSPTEKKEVLSDLETQIDDAYNQGKTDQKIDDTGSGFLTAIKWGVVGLLGYKLIDLISQRSQTHSN